MKRLSCFIIIHRPNPVEDKTMKNLMRMFQNWAARQRVKTEERLAEEKKREAFFLAHRPKYDDPLIPAWVTTRPDNPGVKGQSFNGIFDVAAPKTV